MQWFTQLLYKLQDTVSHASMSDRKQYVSARIEVMLHVYIEPFTIMIYISHIYCGCLSSVCITYVISCLDFNWQIIFYSMLYYKPIFIFHSNHTFPVKGLTLGDVGEEFGDVLR